MFQSEPIFDPLSRRRFLQRGCSAMTLGGLGAAISSLRMTRLVANAQSANDEYRALVCVFLFGGNDSNNLIVPTGSEYATYAAGRDLLAIPEANLLPIATPSAAAGRSFGLTPWVPELHSLYQTGKLALVPNVGSLAGPTSRADYLSGQLDKVPQQLFSHKEQQEQWQTSLAQAPPSTGWGGRLADLVNQLNVDPAISMSVSLAGQSLFEVGNQVFQYGLTPEGSIGLSGFDGSTNAQLRRQALDGLLQHSRTNLFERTYRDVLSGGISAHDTLSAVLPNQPDLQTVFPAGGLGAQLKMAARLIQARVDLRLKRQIFFCGIGDFDTHFEQDVSHPTLLAGVSSAVGSFQSAMEELGLADSVTLFSASDFGRTLSNNGRGSDHGWGGHHFVVGGGVQGGNLYGSMPDFTMGGPDDTTRGRWIPKISVDEYAATFAQWFGVPVNELDAVVPNIGRFATPDLGFFG